MKSAYICSQVLKVIKNNPGLSIDEVVALTCKNAGTKAIQYIQATILVYINAQQIKLNPDLTLTSISVEEFFQLNPELKKD